MNLSKKMSVILLIFFYLGSFCFSQRQSESVSENQIPINQTVSVEETLPIQSDSSVQASNEKQPSTFFVFFRMILVLIFVVACMYAVVHFMKNGLTRPESNDPFLRKVSSVTISPGKSVQIVTLLEHAYLIGVSDSSINLLGVIEDKELVDAMNLYADKNAAASKPKNFNDILALFMPNSAENKNVFRNSAKDAADLLRRQRERLENTDNGGEL